MCGKKVESFMLPFSQDTFDRLKTTPDVMIQASRNRRYSMPSTQQMFANNSNDKPEPANTASTTPQQNAGQQLDRACQTYSTELSSVSDSLSTRDDQLKQANTNVEKYKNLITSLEYKLKEKRAKIESYREATKVTTEELAKKNRQIRKLQKNKRVF